MTLTPRDIDAALARKALWCSPQTHPHWYDRDGVYCGPYYNPDEATWDSSRQLVEGLAAKGYSFEIYSRGALINDEMGIFCDVPWEVIITSRPNNYSTSSADTLPAAIAIAAMRALGIVEGEG